MNTLTNLLPIEWVGYIAFSYSSIYAAELRIEQMADRIGGSLEFTSGRHKGKRYLIEGRFRGDILTFCYYAEAINSTNQGSATFMLDEDNFLGGLFAYYSEDNKHIRGEAEGKFLPLSMATSTTEPFTISAHNSAKNTTRYAKMY